MFRRPVHSVQGKLQLRHRRPPRGKTTCTSCGSTQTLAQSPTWTHLTTARVRNHQGNKFHEDPLAALSALAAATLALTGCGATQGAHLRPPHLPRQPGSLPARSKSSPQPPEQRRCRTSKGIRSRQPWRGRHLRLRGAPKARQPD